MRGLLKNTRAFGDFYDARTGAEAETKIASYCSPDLQKDTVFRAVSSQIADPRFHPIPFDSTAEHMHPFTRKRIFINSPM